MTTPIFDSIINGALSPTKIEQAAVPYSSICQALTHLPNNVSQLESLLEKQLGKYVRFDFAEEKAAPLFIEGEEYHPIPNYKYTISINAFPIPDDSPMNRFYAKIINAQSYHVKLAIEEFSATAKADIDTKGEIKRTLEGLYHLSLQLKNVQDTEVINYSLKQQILSLYYEIAATYTYILPEDKIIPFDDFYYQIFGLYPSTKVKDVFNTAMLSAQIQISIFSNDYEAQKTFLHQIKHNANLLYMAIWLRNSLFAEKYSINTCKELNTERGARMLIRIFQDAKTSEYLETESKQKRIQMIETDLETISSITDINDTSAASTCISWLKDQLRIAETMPGPSTIAGTYSVTSIPIIASDELSTEIKVISTRATEFKEVIKPFQFTSIAKVKALTEEKRDMLIHKIAGESVPYGVAMLVFLGYDEHLKTVYGYNKTAIANHFAKCLKSNERTIRGNLSVLKNDNSTESTSTYTAAIHREAVKVFYNNLIETH